VLYIAYGICDSIALEDNDFAEEQQVASNTDFTMSLVFRSSQIRICLGVNVSFISDIAWATEIKLRAERRTGQLLREMERAGQRRPRHGGGVSSLSDTPTLGELGHLPRPVLRLAEARGHPYAEFAKRGFH
jgi:hypothetical protein